MADAQKISIAVPQCVAEAYEAYCAEIDAWYDAHPPPPELFYGRPQEIPPAFRRAPELRVEHVIPYPGLVTGKIR